jgi:hypothetical protein
VKDQQPSLAEKKQRWELRLNMAEVAYKVLILIVGSVVAAVFLVMQNEQTRSRYFVDLNAQRERADTDLRAEMFKVLFDAYFKNKIQTIGSEQVVERLVYSESAHASQAASGSLNGAHREIMLIDLLARNFENVDVRPLFEDLDERLTAEIDHSNSNGARKATQQQEQAFEQRQELRRVAIGAISRQVAALEGLADPAKKARVSYHSVDTCKLTGDNELEKKVKAEGLIALVEPPLPDEVRTEGGPVHVMGLRDGALDLTIYTLSRQEEAVASSAGSEINPSVTFFDMPTLENLRLLNNKRVAFSMYKYLSSRDCRIFRKNLDKRLEIDCDYLLQSSKDCATAQFRTVILPEDFLGIHDRPFVNDLVAGRYADPWWKFW